MATERSVSDQPWIDRLRFRVEMPAEERVRVLKRFHGRLRRSRWRPERKAVRLARIGAHLEEPSLAAGAIGSSGDVCSETTGLEMGSPCMSPAASDGANGIDGVLRIVSKAR